MQFGAHESMEVHECLLEKINMITHFNLYAGETRNPQLQDMIARHQNEEIQMYNQLVNYVQGEIKGFSPIAPNTNIRGINHQQIQYGVNQPPQYGPESDARFSDWEIAVAMLQCHKNSAMNGTRAALECADPNLRLMLQNSVATCVNQAYEVFLFMNQQGQYPVPTLNEQTAFLNTYQPANQDLQAQYAGHSMNQNAAGQNAPSGNLNVASRDSIWYGNNTPNRGY